MDNIDSVLKAHGSSIKYAVKFNVYVRPQPSHSLRTPPDPFGPLSFSLQPSPLSPPSNSLLT